MPWLELSSFEKGLEAGLQIINISYIYISILLYMYIYIYEFPKHEVGVLLSDG